MARLLTTVPAPKAAGQRRLLALDGGGVRGVLTLEILVALERQLAVLHDEPDLVLSDYFDYFAGTSTGSTIAAGLALGWSAADLLQMYIERLIDLVEPVPVWRWVSKAFRYRYPPEHMTKEIKAAYGADTLFGDARMKSLLLVALHNASTDSPWPLSNNPQALYNDPDAADCNARLPLWKIVRASCAAPFFYPPERVRLGGSTFVFVDGALTPYNNPAFQLFVMATDPAYRLQWQAGVDELLLVSVGTGQGGNARPELADGDVGVRHHASTLVGSLIGGASVHQDLACRVVGDCRFGDAIDSEVGAMLGSPGAAGKQFSYLRYNADLTMAGLRELGVGHLGVGRSLAKLSQITAKDNVSQLREIGRAAAAHQIRPEHFSGFA